MIKFRAWDKEDERMKEVFNLDFHRYTAIVGFRLSEPKSFLNDRPLIILQSTGLKDAHGTEIYEKDIVRDSYGDVLLIEWLDGGFVLTDFFSSGYDHYEIDDIDSHEVIGNQFEHPHLLEE